MSTRVQKGGTKFRPVTNARSRTSESVSRQTSTIPEPRALSLAQTVEQTLEEQTQSSANLAASSSELLVATPTSFIGARTHAIRTPGRDWGNPIGPIPSAPSDKYCVDLTETRHIASIPTNVDTQHAVQSAPIVLPSELSSSSSSGFSAATFIQTPGTTSDRAPGDTQGTTIVDPNDGTAGRLLMSQDSASNGGKTSKKARRKRVTKPRSMRSANAESTSEHEGTHASDSGTKRKRRRKSISTEAKPNHSRKPRRPSAPAFDADIDPGDELDPTVVTMAAICEDTGQGRCSTKVVEILRNHAAWKQANRERVAAQAATMEVRKYGREEQDDSHLRRIRESGDNFVETEAALEQPGSGTPGPSTENGDTSAGEETGDDGFNYSRVVSTNTYNIQVRIGRNGETIIDEDTLYADRNDDPEYANQDYTHIEESDRTKFINSQSYSKKSRGSRWSAEETEMFYDALSQFGENYELISFILPGRDRKACKNKFKAEDKKNPLRITYSLKNRVPYDIQTLSRMTGKDFSGPTPQISMPVVLTASEAPTSPTTTELELPDLAAEADIQKHNATPNHIMRDRQH